MLKRKYFLAILIINFLAIILLTGCGLFNLGGWIVPDDLEFIKLINELNTPIKISNYMIKNFTYESHPVLSLSPYALWKIKLGDCNDFTAFGMFMAFNNSIDVAQIVIYYENNSDKHVLAVYVENDGLSFTDLRIYYNNNYFYFNSFEEIVDWDCENVTFQEWIKYEVYDYWNNLIVEKELK